MGVILVENIDKLNDIDEFIIKDHEQWIDTKSKSNYSQLMKNFAEAHFTNIDRKIQSTIDYCISQNYIKSLKELLNNKNLTLKQINTIKLYLLLN